MIRKYRNEWMVLAALLVLLGGFAYQRSMRARLASSLEQAKTATQQVTEIQTLQTVWATKGLKEKIAALHNLLSASKVKTFDQKKGKLTAAFGPLTGQDLNAVSTRLASLPVQIQTFSIVRNGNTYTMECQCTW